MNNPNVKITINKFIESKNPTYNVLYGKVQPPCIKIWHLKDYDMIRSGWRCNPFQVDVYEVNKDDYNATKTMGKILSDFGFIEGSNRKLGAIPLIDYSGATPITTVAKITIRQGDQGIIYVDDPNIDVRHYKCDFLAEYKK